MGLQYDTETYIYVNVFTCVFMSKNRSASKNSKYLSNVRAPATRNP